MIVPSYSSRAVDDDIKEVVDVTRRFVTGPVLVSAYDIKHFGIKQQMLGNSSLSFLDSGGYEAGKESDFSEVEDPRDRKPGWSKGQYREVISKWDFSKPTVLVNYDNHNRREKLETQIASAKKNVRNHPRACHTLLIKSEPAGRKLRKKERVYVNIDRVRGLVDQLSEFSIIGVTEKELGNSIFERMKNIAKLRKCLSSNGLNTPIHVFGSLDPVTTPLFFLSGADIFDGLTWLRYAFYNKVAIYRQNSHALDHNVPLGFRDGELTAHVHVNNYRFLGTMQEEMKQFLINQNWNAFGEHGEFFRNSIERLDEELGG